MNKNLKKILIFSGIGVAIIGVIIASIIVMTNLGKKKFEEKKPSQSTVTNPEEDKTKKEPIVKVKPLIISSPNSNSVTVTSPEITFSGSCDINEELKINGTLIDHPDGIFTYSPTLKVGKNTFNFEYMGKTTVYTITYRYVIINTYSPSTAQSFESGSTLVVTVTARRGSTVKASLNGTTVTLSPNNASEDDFIPFSGSFNLPKDNVNNINLGKIKYTATYNGKSETFYSGNITCKRTNIIVDYDPSATPTGGKYINVGSGYIAEIVEYNAETFDGKYTNTNSIDWSRPTNNYLPKGTVDYCSTSTLDYGDKKYTTLRSGQRVYLDRKDVPYTNKKPVIKQYLGKLPDHNEISINEFNVGEQHTTIILDSLWKAPFYFELKEQRYTNPSFQDYTISNVTFNYVDITFCYTTMFNDSAETNGDIEIPENPIFKSAKVIKNTADYTLRLFLKKQGAFYGWDSYYNSNNQLCFEFLNPKKINIVDISENPYGVNLNGAKILIDVGHGGKDIGAPGFDYKNHSEAIQNLFLANKLKAELESMGATVYLTRTANTTSSTDDKITKLKELKPDFCIAIHHNSGNSASPNGFSSHYFNAFSRNAAAFVETRTKNTGIYKKSSLLWHYYYTARTTNCPVVLTENGYMSNRYDYNNIINTNKNIEKAKAIATGIADYFKSIQ